MTLQRLQGPITLDGFSDEPAWQSIEPFDVIMHRPTFGLPPTERTEIRVGYDDDYLYVSGRMFDSEPEGIQDGGLDRDNLNPSTDFFGIILDTFNDNENALTFATSPVGIRVDAAVFNDAQGQFPLNVSWNTFWDVAVQKNGQGWFAEMRIPFSSLRFQDRDGQVTMGMTVWRYIPRKFESIVFPPISPKWGFWSNWKPSQAKRIGFEGVYSQNPLYITPYTLGGIGQASELNVDETAYDLQRDQTREMGLDIKYGLSSNLTLDITANTDFAQVEADDEQVNLTRFSLFFPEKRLFFQERSSIFDQSLGGPNRLFYSRRIGLSDEGLVPVMGGLRLVGRLGSWDLGALDMQTAEATFMSEGDTTSIPSENFSVARLRRRVLNPYSYVGGMITSRIATNGEKNIAYLLDGIVRPFGDDYLEVNLAQTFDSNDAETLSALKRMRLRLSWERRSEEGLGFDLSFSRQGKDYNPRLGFVPRENYTLFRNVVSYGWFYGEDSPIFSQIVALTSLFFFGNDDGSLESAEFGPKWDLTFKSGALSSIDLRLLTETLTDTFDLDSSTYVPPGKYTFAIAQGSYATPFGALLRIETSINAGTFYDGRRVSLQAKPTWVISRYLELSGGIELNRIRFSSRNQEFDSRIFRLRSKITLSTVLSISSFIQYNNEIDGIIVNLRLRYNPKEGTDLYVVYNEGINTDRHRLEPSPPFTDSRIILLKYSTTFQPRL
ncbi:MAG: DUF5916 domain-containing protein [Candidatus Neomarinimicrobiota bacterium]